MDLITLQNDDKLHLSYHDFGHPGVYILAKRELGRGFAIDFRYHYR